MKISTKKKCTHTYFVVFNNILKFTNIEKKKKKNISKQIFTWKWWTAVVAYIVLTVISHVTLSKDAKFESLIPILKKNGKLLRGCQYN